MAGMNVYQRYNCRQRGRYFSAQELSQDSHIQGDRRLTPLKASLNSPAQRSTYNIVLIVMAIHTDCK